jgi:hypothetical protein
MSGSFVLNVADATAMEHPVAVSPGAGEAPGAPQADDGLVVPS